MLVTTVVIEEMRIVLNITVENTERVEFVGEA
jgi:hypothetical protein